MSVPLLPLPLPPARDLDELFSRFVRCYRCPLAYSRRHIVPGCGTTEGGIALLTDRVAGVDERDGKLLSGPAGDLQEKILAAPRVEIPTDHVYLTSAVLCRAPRDRMPRTAEMIACNNRLRRELALVRPRIIVALGTRAGAALFANPKYPPEPHRWLFWSDGEREIPAYVTLHPLEAAWGPAGEIKRRKRILYDDWQAISARFCGRHDAFKGESAGRGMP